MRTLSCCLAIIMILALPTLATAQGGRLSGRIKDEAGEPLADVEAKLIDVETGAEVVQLSTKKGRFSLAVVHVDRDYEILLVKEGYVPIRESVRLKYGEPVQGSWVMIVDRTGGAPVFDLSDEEIQAKQAAVDLYNEGAHAVQAGDLTTAAAKFEAAIAEDPALVEAYPIAAAANLEVDNFARALELADIVLASEPDNARILGVRYDALNGLGREEEAAAALDYLIANAPQGDTAKRAYNRALAYATKGEVDTAITLLDQTLALDDTLTPAWGLLGDLQMALGDHERVIEIGDRLMEIEGSQERGWSLRHRACEAMGDEECATEARRELAALNPDAVMNSLFEQGNDLFTNNQPEAAIAIFRQVLDLQPENALAHFELGRSALSAGDIDTARTHLLRFLELAPEDPQATLANEMLSYLD